MSVRYERPEYGAAKTEWALCRDAIDRRSAVVKYLAGLSVKDDKDAAAINKIYRDRAVYYNAAGYTVNVYIGMARRKAPSRNVSTVVENWLTALDAQGRSFDELSWRILRESIVTNRGGVLMDYPNRGDEVMSRADAERRGYLPRAVVYCAENITNWPEEDEPEQYVLRESFYKRSDDGFKLEPMERHRVLKMQEGVYQHDIYEGKPGTEPTFIKTLIPRKRNGKPWDYVPFKLCDAEGNTSNVKKPMILDLAEVNVRHFYNSADLEHGLHYTGIPTPYLFGVRDEDAPDEIGARTIWTSEDSTAHAGYVEFTGSGLSNISDAMAEKVKYMATLGTRNIMDGQDRNETATGVLVRHTGGTANLAGACESVSEMARWMLNVAEDMLTGRPGDNEYAIETDFNPQQLSAQEMTAMLAAMHGGGISQQAFIEAMQKGQRITDTRTVEEEMALIEQDDASGLEDQPPIPEAA